MRGGAPHEAERGLSTAMDRLQEPDKSEALLLLGEALQEQGRMHESIEFLDRVSDTAQSSVLSRRNILRLYAGSFANESRNGKHDQIAEQLVKEAQTSSEVNTRLRALWIAASLLRDRREPTLRDIIWCRLEAENWSALAIEDKAEFALGRAFCLYHAGEKARSLATINDVIGDLETQGIANSVYLALILGAGAISAGLGDYRMAVSIEEKGLQVARKMGEERRSRILAANLALAHCRLGNTEEQLRWANSAVATDDPHVDLFHQQQVQYFRAQALAVQGHEAEAIAAMTQECQTNIQHLPSYLQQAWSLRLADIFALLGRWPESLREARKAVTGDLAELRSDAFAGLYARWSVRLAVAGVCSELEVQDRLAALQAREPSLDRIDQALVLNAKVWLDQKRGEVILEEREEMWRRLVALPAGVTNELNRLGMLDA